MNCRPYLEGCRQLDNKFSVGDDEGSENSWAKVVGKHVKENWGLCLQKWNQCKKLYKIQGMLYGKNRTENPAVIILFFYRVPKSDVNAAAERNVADKGFCMQLLFGLNAGVAEEDIRKVFRLGRKGVNDQVPRPILVHLSSHTAKTLVMENSYKLKSLPWHTI